MAGCSVSTVADGADVVGNYFSRPTAALMRTACCPRAYDRFNE
jgi:hypothetical protein